MSKISGEPTVQPGLRPGVVLTVETVFATREHYAELAESCARSATEDPNPGPGQFRVNDLASYVAWQTDIAERSRAGEFDHGFTYRQWGHWHQTGESVALLPK